MTRLAIGCVAVAVIASALRFGVDAGDTPEGARILFFVFLVTFFLSCVHGSAGRRSAHRRTVAL